MTLPEFEPLLVKLMSSIVLFRELQREDLVHLLRGASKAAFDAGDLVFEEGFPGHSVYVVVHGRFEVFKVIDGTEAHIADVLPGEHFGEMALVTDRQRMASVRATEDSVALRLTKTVIFAQPRLAVSLLKNMTVLMADHLAEMNDVVLLLDVSRRQKLKATAAPPDSEPDARRSRVVARNVG